MKILFVNSVGYRNNNYHLKFNKNNKSNFLQLTNEPISTVNFKGINTLSQSFEYGLSLEELKDRLSPEKYTKWDLLSPKSIEYKSLADGDKKALAHLVRASEYFNDVYKRLDDVHNLEFEKFLATRIAQGDEKAVLTKKLYDGQKGINGKSVDGADVNLAKGIKTVAGKGFYTLQKQKEILTSWIVGYLPLGADLSNAHRARNIMQYNYFIQNGGIKFDNNGKIKIDFAKITQCGEKMAKEYIEKYAVWTKELDILANKLKPIDKRLNSYLYSPIAKEVLKKIK